MTNLRTTAPHSTWRPVCLAVLLAWPVAAWCADDDDALSLQAAPAAEAPAPTAAPETRLYGEAAVGQVWQRYGQPTLTSHRLSIDLSHRQKLAPGWRWAISDRLDSARPVGDGETSTLNSLREAYVSWQAADGGSVVDLGRVNLRNGPGYGYNPTDYLRGGALRTVTTTDPIALRDNRLGTVMLRAQRLWTDGGVSLSLAPKLADGPSKGSFSLDLGATNASNKLLATWSLRPSDRISGQLLAFAEQGRSTPLGAGGGTQLGASRGTQLGVSATALLSDAAVAHVEASRGRADDLLAQALGQPVTPQTRNKLVTGLTFTTSNRLALTAEYAYNGAAPDRATWQAAGAAGPQALGRYLQIAQLRQDNATRQAWLFYASQKSLGLKNLDLTALLRINADDHSRLAWVELRHHWDHADLALQWQGTQGAALSEYGVQPYRQTLQLLGTWFF